MITTYEMIKALPGKGFDWMGFSAALRAAYRESCTLHHKVPHSLVDANVAIGVRELRASAMCMAGSIVDFASKTSRFIKPSSETLAWGGILGGEYVVLTDKNAAQLATNEIHILCEMFK